MDIFQARAFTNSTLHVPLHAPLLIIGAAASGVAVGAGMWYWLRWRKKKPESELERERRLSVNATGRMTDGSLTEAFSVSEHFLIFYQYSVAGVEYTAAQDLSNLREMIPPSVYMPGEAVTVKYSHNNPSNSIVLCERWSGLHRNGGSHASHEENAPVLRAE